VYFLRGLSSRGDPNSQLEGSGKKNSAGNRGGKDRTGEGRGEYKSFKQTGMNGANIVIESLRKLGGCGTDA